MNAREEILLGVIDELRTLETPEGQGDRVIWRAREMEAFSQWRAMNRGRTSMHPEREYDGQFFHLQYQAGHVA